MAVPAVAPTNGQVMAPEAITGSVSFDVTYDSTDYGFSLAVPTDNTQPFDVKLTETPSGGSTSTLGEFKYLASSQTFSITVTYPGTIPLGASLTIGKISINLANGTIPA